MSNHSDRLVMFLGLTLATGALLGLGGCGAPSVNERLTGKPTLSPGPSGWLAGEDLRVPLVWISGSRPSAAGDYARKLTVDGRERYYEVHVPPGYVVGQAMPVVLVLHGGGGFPGVARYMTGMSELADDTGGFLAVYPAGTDKRRSDRKLFWNAGWEHKVEAQGSVDDVQYFADLLDDLGAHFSVDQNRVYATGISNGAHMTFRLAAELSHRIAAVATVGGQVSPGQLAAPPPRPFALMHFHGRDDLWNPWLGGSPPMSSFTNVQLNPVPDVIRAWAEHNGCRREPIRQERVGAALGSFYASPVAGAEVVLWELEDGGHTWPSGRATKVERTGKIAGIKFAEPVGKINTDVSASALMWSFFQRHSLVD